ncbi:hypothetical protein CsSME_00051558 [Camellia sinensis var. sinensis]
MVWCEPKTWWLPPKQTVRGGFTILLRPKQTFDGSLLRYLKQVTLRSRVAELVLRRSSQILAHREDRLGVERVEFGTHVPITPPEMDSLGPL